MSDTSHLSFCAFRRCSQETVVLFGFFLCRRAHCSGQLTFTWLRMEFCMLLICLGTMLLNLSWASEFFFLLRHDFCNASRVQLFLPSHRSKNLFYLEKLITFTKITFLFNQSLVRNCSVIYSLTCKRQALIINRQVMPFLLMFDIFEVTSKMREWLNELYSWIKF